MNYKRIVLGSFLFMAFIGEVSVGFYSGLFTPPGLLILSCLYVILFLLYEALDKKYQFTNIRAIMLAFGIYSVGITGLLHGEIANYVLTPQNNLITTLIRIQCSLFPVFAYYLLNKIYPRKNTEHVPSLRTMIIIFTLFILILSPSQKFGLIAVYHTFQIAPMASTVFAILGLISILLALRQKTSQKPPYSNRIFTIISIGLFILSLVPLLQTFIVLVLLTILYMIWLLLIPAFRSGLLQ